MELALPCEIGDHGRGLPCRRCGPRERQLYSEKLLHQTSREQRSTLSSAPSFSCRCLALVEPSLKLGCKGTHIYSLPGHREGRTQKENWSEEEGWQEKRQHDRVVSIATGGRVQKWIMKLHAPFLFVYQSSLGELPGCLKNARHWLPFHFIAKHLLTWTPYLVMSVALFAQGKGLFSQ